MSNSTVALDAVLRVLDWLTLPVRVVLFAVAVLFVAVVYAPVYYVMTGKLWD